MRFCLVEAATIGAPDIWTRAGLWIVSQWCKARDGGAWAASAPPCSCLGARVEGFGAGLRASGSIRHRLDLSCVRRDPDDRSTVAY